MGSNATNTPLPTGMTLQLPGGMPVDLQRRSVQVEQGFRHEDSTGGALGNASNVISPKMLLTYTPVQIVVPLSATRVRILVRSIFEETNSLPLDNTGQAIQSFRGAEAGILIGLSSTLNQYSLPNRTPAVNTGGSGSFPIFASDGVVERPVAGMTSFYIAAMNGQVAVYFEFLVLSNS